MKLALLTRRELEAINRQGFRYPLAVAEKDYLLAVVSKVIYKSPLRDKLVFKGGTAIHHCYIPQARFSEDLDFTSLDKHITLAQVKAALEIQDFLEVKKEYVSKFTIKIERLKYSGPLGQPNSLKVEIDFLQNVVLSAKDIIYKNAWGVKTRARVMDVKEIYAEKIRAASDRARYRDFYDLTVLQEKYKFDMARIRALIDQKEIRKPITASSIIKNWEIAKEEKKRELDAIYYSMPVSDIAIEEMIAGLKI